MCPCLARYLGMHLVHANYISASLGLVPMMSVLGARPSIVVLSALDYGLYI